MTEDDRKAGSLPRLAGPAPEHEVDQSLAARSAAVPAADILAAPPVLRHTRHYLRQQQLKRQLIIFLNFNFVQKYEIVFFNVLRLNVRFKHMCILL